MKLTNSQKKSMIYPPVGDLVNKIGQMTHDNAKGNRYSLVIVTAKRARVISDREAAQNRKNSEAESTLHLKDRTSSAKSSNESVVKPIVESLHEIMNDDIYLTNDASSKESYKRETPIIIDDNGEDAIDFSAIMSEAPSNAPVGNGLTGNELIENDD